MLRGESFGVLELCRILDIRQSALSHHLKILANAKIVSTRREGNSIFYRRALLKDDDPYREIKESILERVDDTPIPNYSKKQIKQIQLERAEQSLSFFKKGSTTKVFIICAYNYFNHPYICRNNTNKTTRLFKINYKRYYFQRFVFYIWTFCIFKKQLL